MSGTWRTKELLASAGQAGQRSLWKSMGYTDEDLSRPLIGVHNTWSETCPGHYNLRLVTEAVRAGIWQAGGTPMEFADFAQCPNISMGGKGILYDSPTRDLVAACVEACTGMHMFDGLVLISACDKMGPAHWLAAARLDLPTILVCGGPMQAGSYKGKTITAADVLREGYGMGAGLSKLSLAELKEMEDCACPDWGSCALLGTANTTQCLSEAVGLALPGGGTAPATSAKRLWLSKASGRRIVELVHEGIRASDILTKEAIENMIMVLHAIGGSTNALVHVLALIEELDMGDSLGLDTVDVWSDKIPWITDVLPGGRYSVGDFDEAGGVQAVMTKLRKHLNLNCSTVNGKTVAENLEKARVTRPEIIKDMTEPLYEHGMMVLRGNLATSAIVRPSVIPSKMLNIAGPARVFESEAGALEALKNRAIQPGSVIVVKYEGPRGAPGLREMLELTCYLGVSGLDQSVAILTDGKFSGFAKGPFICQVTPEAAMGGPFAVVEEGDIIEIDIPAKRLNLRVSDEEIKKRIDRWQPREAKVRSGFLTLYARLAEPCSKGAGLQLKL